MPFTGDYPTAAILIKVELPSKTIRICDGGLVLFSGEGDATPYLYESEDSDYGSIASGDALTEGQGDEVPASVITFLPNGNAATGSLTSPDMQWSPVSMWLVELDPMTGAVIDQEDYFFGVIDIPTFREVAEGRAVDMKLVATTELFFQVNDGNRLSTENHNRVHPGERGLDNMTGVEIEVPWGTERRPRNAGSGGSGGGGGGGGGGGSPGGGGYHYFNQR